MSGLQECMGNGFFKVGEACRSFWSGLENLDFSLGGYLYPNLPPKKSLGGGAKAFKMHFLEIGIWKCDYGKKCPLTWDIFMVHDVNNPSSGSFS